MNSISSCHATRLVFFGDTGAGAIYSSVVSKVTCLVASLLLVVRVVGSMVSSKTTISSGSSIPECGRGGGGVSGGDSFNSISTCHWVFSLFFSIFNWSKKSWKPKQISSNDF